MNTHSSVSPCCAGVQCQLDPAVQNAISSVASQAANDVSATACSRSQLFQLYAGCRRRLLLWCDGLSRNKNYFFLRMGGEREWVTRIVYCVLPAPMPTNFSLKIQLNICHGCELR